MGCEGGLAVSTAKDGVTMDAEAFAAAKCGKDTEAEVDS